MRRYAVVIEPGKRNLGAWAPDFLGCISTGRTLPEMRRMIREALEFHMEGMAEYGESIPPPSTTCARVDVGPGYAAFIERTRRGFTAHAPDFDGCLAAASTRRGALLLLGDVLRTHLSDLKWSGDPVPMPSCLCEMVEVRLPSPGKSARGRALAR